MNNGAALPLLKRLPESHYHDPLFFYPRRVDRPCLEKARQQPDKLRQVLDTMRTDGFVQMLEAVSNNFDEIVEVIKTTIRLAVKET